MRFQIMHESAHTLRVRAPGPGLSLRQADLLEATLRQVPGVEDVAVHERTGGIVIRHGADRGAVVACLAAFSFESAEEGADPAGHTARALNREYKEKIVFHVIRRYLGKLYLPAPIRHALAVIHAVPYITTALRCLARGQITVELLDGVAIGTSLLTGDFETAGSVMFLLKLGDCLDEWTHKKTVHDLAASMSLQVDRVWLRTETGQETPVPVRQIRPGDCIVVHAGNVIPLDGEIVEGEVMINQASLTGEPLAAARRPGATVFAGSVLEEGRCVIRVTQTTGDNKYDRIVRMIEESEKLNSRVESRAAGLADRLVPWCLGGAALTYALTRNVTRAVSVLMVDFSCALKLAMPLSVLSAMREASGLRITVKGGKYLEKVAEAHSIIFDKTGTLTYACPRVAEVVPFHGQNREEMLRIAACLEEHFPHSIANAVVKAAADEGLDHSEMHSKVQYIVAHGIASTIGEERAVIGSWHFVFEDENAVIDPADRPAFEMLGPEYSHLYLAIGGVLSAVICISDPLRAEAADTIRLLREAGFQRTVMLTGDSYRTARAIAAQVGVDDFHAEVLPEEKAEYIRQEQAAGRIVIMLGDGINDAPALSFADVGIAIGTGAAIAREVADITIAADDLRALVLLRQLSEALMRRIHRNYRFIMGFNGLLIVLGALGILPPTVSAALHNGSTLALSLNSMTKLL